MNIILCGLQASGKTTLGKALSKELMIPFIDTDELIETSYTKGLSCREIYKKEGSDYFRRLEKQVVLALKPASQTLIALGGGSLDDADSLAHIKQLGVLIYLKVPLNTLWERVLLKGIPSYLDPNNPEENFYALAKRRIPFYEQAADLIWKLSLP